MSDDEEKLEEKYEYIKQSSTIYVINEIQEDSGIEATIDDRKDQPYVEGSVVKVNKASQDVEVYIAELQKNIIVKFEQTLPLSNMQLLKKRGFIEAKMSKYEEKSLYTLYIYFVSA